MRSRTQRQRLSVQQNCGAACNHNLTFSFRFLRGVFLHLFGVFLSASYIHSLVPLSGKRAAVLLCLYWLSSFPCLCKYRKMEISLSTGESHLSCCLCLPIARGCSEFQSPGVKNCKEKDFHMNIPKRSLLGEIHSSNFLMSLMNLKGPVYIWATCQRDLVLGGSLVISGSSLSQLPLPNSVFLFLLSVSPQNPLCSEGKIQYFVTAKDLWLSLTRGSKNCHWVTMILWVSFPRNNLD